MSGLDWFALTGAVLFTLGWWGWVIYMVRKGMR